MKTMNILVSLVATFVMTLSANAETISKNETASISTVTELAQQGKTVVKFKGNSKIVYNTDNQGRVVSKVVLHRGAGNWVPVSVYTANFGDTENTLTYARWNSDSHVFNRNAKQVHYDTKQFPVLIAMPE